MQINIKIWAVQFTYIRFFSSFLCVNVAEDNNINATSDRQLQLSHSLTLHKFIFDSILGSNDMGYERKI